MTTVVINERAMRELLREIGKLPKDVQKRLQLVGYDIGAEIIAPTIRNAMQATTGNYAPKLSRSVKVYKSKRPSVRVGGKSQNFSGGASPTILRYGSIRGAYVAKGGYLQKWAEPIQNKWTQTASDHYTTPALNEWYTQVTKIVDDWNRGF